MIGMYGIFFACMSHDRDDDDVLERCHVLLIALLILIPIYKKMAGSRFKDFVEQKPSSQYRSSRDQ